MLGVFEGVWLAVPVPLGVLVPVLDDDGVWLGVVVVDGVGVDVGVAVVVPLGVPVCVALGVDVGVSQAAANEMAQAAASAIIALRIRRAISDESCTQMAQLALPSLEEALLANAAENASASTQCAQWVRSTLGVF
jgi:hypothetical protein